MAEQHFYIDTQGNDDEAYREAMQFACDLANNDNSIKKVVLLLATKNVTGWFDRIYGSDTVKKLFAGTHFKGCKPLFKFETVRTYSDNQDLSEIVITCGLDEDDIFKFEDYYSVKVIIAIPWLRAKIQKWARTFNPTDLRGQATAVAAYPEPSCIVQKALSDLTDSVNMSTGIHNPMDEDLAKTYILALHKYEKSLDKNVVGAYLITALGWDAEHAKDVEKLIETLDAGKHFKGGTRTGLQNQYKRWKAECEG